MIPALGAAAGMSGGFSTSGGAAGPSGASGSQTVDSGFNVSFGNSRIDSTTAKNSPIPANLSPYIIPALGAVALLAVLWTLKK